MGLPEVDEGVRVAYSASRSRWCLRSIFTSDGVMRSRTCAARRMHQTAAFLADHVLPDVPLRQWVLAPPFPLVPLRGARPEVLREMGRRFVA